MQSCIWQHLRASFFHAGFNLICCQGIEEAEHSMELYSAGHRHRDGWMNVWPELWSVIITLCIKQRTVMSLEFYLRKMAREVLHTLALFWNFKTQGKETVINVYILNYSRVTIPDQNMNWTDIKLKFLGNVSWDPKPSVVWVSACFPV